MTTVAELLAANNIKVTDTKPGRYYTLCPKCSHQRSRANQNSKCLGVTIEDGERARWGCNHCGWTGPEGGGGNGRDPDNATYYVYRDVAGNARFRKVRWRDRKSGERRFKLQHFDSTKWVNGTKGIDTTILYRIDEVVEAIKDNRPIAVVEGEKDADNLWALGIAATTSAHGAADVVKNPNTKPKWYAVHSEQLRGADIIVFNDNDLAGYAHAEETCKLSVGIANRIRRLDLKAATWPNMPLKADVSDWLAKGGTREQLDALMESAPDYVPPPPPPPPPPDDTDEDKIALEFSALHADDMRYVAAWGRWYKWDGVCWRHETTLQAFDEARVLVRAAPIKTKAQVVSAVVTMARADRRQAATTDQWDTDPWLLGTPGGTVDLHTGKLRAAQPRDYIIKQTAVAPKRIPTPLWTAYLEKVTNGDKDLQAFLQRWAGYSLTGSTVEHALVFLYGRGKNGKSTFLETISRILGDYHQKADMELLNASKFARHSTEVAVLRGARMVTAIETGEEKSWDEAKIKALTGGDTLSARFMRQDPFSFVPQFKFTIGGNHKPVIRTVDEAIRRRLIMAPFTVTIPEKERDKDLGEKLKAEWPGILAWMIDGCLEWQHVGLAKPQAVLDTTATYLEAQDVLQDFIDTCCAVGKTESDTFEGIWDGWTDYCDDCREPSGTKRTFGQRLQDKGFMPVKGGKGVRRYQGLRCMRENTKKLLAQAALSRKGKT